jgi:flap endonuclease-1
MGIKKLINWIKTNSAYGLQLITFKEMSNKTLGIDASIFIYRSELAIKGAGYEMRNDKQEITSHLYITLFQIIKLLENQITPVYVFDGKYNALKHKTMEERKQKVNLNKNLIKKSKSKEETNKLEIRSFQINDQMIKDLKTMLTLCGIPYIQAEEESDQLLAYLDMNGYTEGTISEDTDIVVFGGLDLYKNVFPNVNLKTKPKIEHIKYNKILDDLDWSRSQFVDLALLLGSDYAEHINGVGPVKATELVNENDDIYNIVKDLSDKKTAEIYEKAKEFLMTDGLKQSKEIKKKLEDLKLKKANKVKLFEFLIKDKQLNKERTEKAIDKLIKLNEEFNK